MAGKTSLSDLRQAAAKHYREISDAAGNFNSFAAEAILSHNPNAPTDAELKQLLRISEENTQLLYDATDTYGGRSMLAEELAFIKSIKERQPS